MKTAVRIEGGEFQDADIESLKMRRGRWFWCVLLTAQQGWARDFG